MKKIIAGMIITTLILSSCTMKIPDKSDIPTWDVELSAPLINLTVKVEDVKALADSPFVKIEFDGDSIFAFQDTSKKIEKVEVGDQLEIDDINESFSQNVDDVTVGGTNKNYTSGFDTVGVDPIEQVISSKLGKISLNDTDPIETAPVKFTDIVDMDIVPEGASATISQGEGIPTIYRDIKFDDFDNAVFSDGYLSINIVNDLVIELGYDITIRLLGADSTTLYGTDDDSAKAVWDVGIMPGNSAERTISLTNKTLPSDIIVQISGAICGSGDAIVINNSSTRESSFVVQVEAKSLEVVSADAIVPSQEIDTTGVIELADSENKVKSAKILEGTLAINIANDLPINSTLYLNIYSIADNIDGSGYFSHEINLSANQASNNDFPLIDKYLVMDINDQKVEYDYRVVTEDTDPNRVTVSELNGVGVEILLFGLNTGEQITFAEFTGKVKQDPIIESGEIDISSDSKITEAVIKSGTMTISILNNVNQTDIGVPKLSLAIPEFFDAGENSISYNEIDLTHSQPAVIEIDLANYFLRPNTVNVSADSFRQNITYETIVAIPSDETATFNLLDSIKIDIVVSDLSFTSVTGFFNQEPINEQSSIGLVQATKIDVAKFFKGQLELKIINNIQAQANIQFKIDEIVDQITGAPLVHSMQLPDSPEDTLKEIIDLNGYQIDMELDMEADTQFVNYSSNITIPSDKEMTLEFGQNIEVIVSLVDLGFSQVSGFIDTVSIDIDSVETELPEFPDEMKDINLGDVQIALNFDSNIGIDLFLNLTLEAFNEDGDTVKKVINHTIISDDDATKEISIPDAQDLINIKPSMIIAYGSAKIGGYGNITTEQYVQGKMEILVPLILSIEEGAKLDSLNFSKVSGDITGIDLIESIVIGTSTNNEFDFGAKVLLLAAKDTLYFDLGSSILPDTLLKIELLPGQADDEISITEDKFDLFQDSLYIKPVVELLGRDDGEPSTLYKSDSLSIFMYGIIRAKVDIQEITGNDDEEE